MSKQNALLFLERLENDEQFRKSVINARKALKSQSPIGDMKHSEFDFDIKDMYDAMYERGTNLSVEQIKEITGGVSNLIDDKLEVIAFMHVYGVTKAET